MLKSRFSLIKLTIVALLAAGFLTQSYAEWKSSYNAQGNNVGLYVQKGWGGPLSGRHQFPRGSGNLFVAGRWNWGVMTAMDVDGDGTVEDTLGHGSRGGRIRGMNVTLESYNELAALYAAGENMDEASNRLDHNRIQVSTDPEDLAEWYPEFREGRTASGAPIVHGAETINVRNGQALDSESWNAGPDMEYQFYLLNFAKSNNTVFGHIFIRNMSEYLKWSSNPDIAAKAASQPDGITWKEWTYHYLVANGGIIGARDEGWAFMNPGAIQVITDRNGVESSFTESPFMVVHYELRLPSFNGEDMRPTNLIEHGWNCEFGFCGSADVLESGYSYTKAYRVSQGVPYSENVWPGVISPWNGKQIHGWPGLLDPSDSRYNQWIWGERNSYNHYQFFGALHDFGPRDSTSSDFIIAFVKPANPPFNMPRSETAYIDDPAVQSQLQPALDYVEDAKIVAAGGYIVPETPAPPTMTIIPGNRSVTITWSDVNVHTPDAYYGFLQQFPALDPNGVYRQYDFEGYRLYRSFVGPSDSHSTKIFEGSISGNNLQYYFVDSYEQDVGYQRLSNGLKVWYALVPFDRNYDTNTGKAFSLPLATSGKIWNRPGPGGLFSITPRADANNYKAAALEGVTFVPNASKEAFGVSFASLSGNEDGFITETPIFIAPSVTASLVPIISEKITSALSVYLSCTDWGPNGYRAGRRYVAMTDASGNVLDSSAPFVRVRSGGGNNKVAFHGGQDADGATYAVSAVYDNHRTGSFHTQIETGSYSGASVGFAAWRWGESVENPWTSNEAWVALAHTGQYVITWKSSGSGLSVDVTENVRGGSVAFSPYLEDRSWGFIPAGVSLEDVLFDYGMNWNGNANSVTPKADRGIKLVETIPASNTDDFYIWVDGAAFKFSDVASMPAAGAVMTVTSAFGDWSGTTFSQQPDVIVPGDKWKFDVTPSSLNPEDTDLSKIMVVPNPYLASSFLDLSPDSRRIDFVNLPDRCTIRIYSLGGHLVNVLNHIGANRNGWGDYTDWDRLNTQSEPRVLTGYDNHGGQEPWNLRNRFGQTVASGLYFYHVTDSRGKTHTGKFYIVN